MVDFHDLKVEWVPIEDVDQHPQNANNGDVDAIASSMTMNGVYQPIHVQRSTGYIIMGNHRYQALAKLGQVSIPVIYLDVDDATAKRMMLADNRSARLGYDDESLVLNLLEDIMATDQGLAGSLYTARDLSYLNDLANGPLDLGSTPDVKLPEDLGPAAKKKPDHLLGFAIEPRVTDDGYAYELIITKPGLASFRRSDLNRIRKAFGQEPLTDEEWDAFGTSNG